MSYQEPVTVYFALETFLGLFTEQESYWSYGGAEMQMYYLARGFAKTPGVSVVLLTKNKVPKIVHPNIKIVRFRMPYLGDPSVKHRYLKLPILKQLSTLYLRFVNAKRREKIFIDHEGKAVFLMSQLENEDLIKTAQKRGVQTVYRVNGDSLVDSSMVMSSPSVQRVHRIMNMVDALVVQSDYQKEQTIKNLGLNSVVIGSSYITPERNNRGRKKQVLWVGRCVPIKQPWIFVSLAKRIPECTFIMVAPPDVPLLYEQLEREGAFLSNFEIIPGMKHDELLALYKESSVVASTSFSEGMPNTLIEASFASVPFVSFQLALGGLLEAEGIGRYAEGDMDKFEQVVRTYLFNDCERESTGNRAYSFASRRWDSKIVAAQYVELFRGLGD